MCNINNFKSTMSDNFTTFYFTVRYFKIDSGLPEQSCANNTSRVGSSDCPFLGSVCAHGIVQSLFHCWYYDESQVMLDQKIGG